MTSTRLIKQFRVDHPHHFQLASVDPTDTGGLDLDKEAAHQVLARDIEKLAKLQERLYAQHQWALLVVLQGMDTGSSKPIHSTPPPIDPFSCTHESVRRTAEGRFIEQGAFGRQRCAYGWCAASDPPALAFR